MRGTATSHTTRGSILWGIQTLGDTSECQTPPRKCECANHTPGTGGHAEKETGPPPSCQARAFLLTPTFRFLSFLLFFFKVFCLQLVYLKHVTEKRTDGIYQLMRRLSQLLKACLVSFLKKKKKSCVRCIRISHTLPASETDCQKSQHSKQS